MPKKTVSELLVLATDEDLIAAANGAGLKAMTFPGDDIVVDFSDKKIIVLDTGNAVGLAMELAESGVDPATIEWLDDSVGPGGLRAFFEDRRNIARIADHSRDLYWQEIRTLHDAYEDPALAERIPSGIPCLDPHLQYRRREVIVVAGAYGCGKSTLTQILGMKWAEGEGGKDREIPVWFCTWEDDPIEQRDQVLRHYTHGRCEEADESQIAKAIEMQKRILHTNPEMERERYLDWYVARARYMNEKFGTNYFSLDPWSEFDHLRGPRETETEYVKSVMKQLGKLATELDSIFAVVTHISARMYSEDGSIKPFRIANAFGSVQFGSTATRGICVLRTPLLVGSHDHMVVHFDKIKIERNMGRKGTLALIYDEDRHDLILDAGASRAAADLWSGKRP